MITKSIQQKSLIQKLTYDENSIIQFLEIGFDQSTDWNKNIDKKLKELNFQK